MEEQEQEQRLQESVAIFDQIKSEKERLQRRQQAVASGKKKKRTPTEPLVTRSRQSQEWRGMKRPDRAATLIWTAWLKST